MGEENIPRMRTVDECYAHIKKLDPDSKISKPGIRRMANNGEIPIIKSGRATLINLDALLDYLRKGSAVSAIRPVELPQIGEKRKRADKNYYGGVRVVKG